MSHHLQNLIVLLLNSSTQPTAEPGRAAVQLQSQGMTGNMQPINLVCTAKEAHTDQLQGSRV